MPKIFTSEFLTSMDERLWFRMIVCMLPGLVAAKLSGSSVDGSLLNNMGTAVLVIGVALYAFWGRLRGLSKGDEAYVEPDDAAEHEIASQASRVGGGMSGKEQLLVLAELRTLCQEADRESDRLIALEIAVNPNFSFADATKSALARRRIAAG